MLTKTVDALETQAVLNKVVATLEADAILTERVDTLDHSGGRDKVAKPALTCSASLSCTAQPALRTTWLILAAWSQHEPWPQTRTGDALQQHIHIEVACF